MFTSHIYLNIRFWIILFLTTLITSCINDDKRVGNYGTSDNVRESRAYNLFIQTYVPNRFSLTLIDSSMVKIDTAWAEAEWIYDKNSKPLISDTIKGYNFIIPILKQDFRNFKFSFSPIDTLNGTGYGLQESKYVFNPKVLKDTIKILVEQKNPDTTYGWTRPITKDTILFIKK